MPVVELIEGGRLGSGEEEEDIEDEATNIEGKGAVGVENVRERR